MTRCDTCGDEISQALLEDARWTDYSGRDRCVCEECCERAYEREQERSRDSGGAAAEQSAMTDVYLNLK